MSEFYEGNDPVGHPYRVKKRHRNYQGSGGQPGNLDLEAGDIGTIIKVDEAAPAYVRVKTFKTGQKGWVLKSAIQISKAKVGQEVEIKVEGRARISSGLSTMQIRQSECPVSKAIEALLCAINDKKDELYFMPAWWVQSTGQKGEKIKDLTDMIVGGIEEAGALDILNGKDFYWQDLRNLQNIDRRSHRGVMGVYLRIYWGSDDDEDAVYVYLGQSTDFSVRFGAHNFDCWDEIGRQYHGIHYTRMRKCKHYCMVPLVIFDEDASSETWPSLKLAEQLFILLFNTYSRRVLNFNLIPSARAPIDLNTEASNTFGHGEVGQLLLQVAQEAATVSGWCGGCSRASFGVSVGNGCNVSSPMTESAIAYEKTLWLESSAEFPGVGSVTQYRKATEIDCVIQDEAHGPRALTLMANNQARGLEIRFPKGEGPPEGTRIQAVFEFVDSKAKHPRCFARLPDVGCFKDWAAMNSFAFRAEWEGDDGNTVVQYIQRPNYMSVDADNHYGSYSTYNWASALFRYFHRTTSAIPRNWDVNFGFARVREILVDFFHQRVWFTSELGASDEVAISTSRRDRHFMAVQLERTGLTGASQNRWRNFPPGSRKYPGAPRSTCDTCYEVKGDTTIRKCVQAPNSEDCTLCLTYFGRPCTWTDKRLIENTPANAERRSALYTQPKHPESVIHAKLDTQTYEPLYDDDKDEEDDEDDEDDSD